MSPEKPEQPELPENPEDQIVNETLEQTEYFVPVNQLSDDPQELKKYIQTLHLNLAKGILVTDYQLRFMSYWKDKVQKKFDEMGETSLSVFKEMNSVINQLGRSND